jgi:arylsulfatase A-like enzyme
VLVTRNKGGQPLYARLWGSGFLPSLHQGVQFRAGKDPVLYLNNPDGVSGQARRQMLDRLKQLHELQLLRTQDPAVEARIAQYEMAYRMQTSVPEVADVSDEPDHIFEMYGPDSRQPGTFAANCLLARRLAERNVQFVQLFHQGWDQHGNLPNAIRQQCKETDQASAALVKDLKQRGMLDDTLVVWGGEFGRTNYSQGKLTPTNYGRDHHPRSFTMWLAGGGIRPATVYGETDPYGYNIVEDPVHVHDLHATMLYLLGIDHERLTYKHQGRRYRLTDVHGNVIRPLLA